MSCTSVHLWYQFSFRENDLSAIFHGSFRSCLISFFDMVGTGSIIEALNLGILCNIYLNNSLLVNIMT